MVSTHNSLSAPGPSSLVAAIRLADQEHRLFTPGECLMVGMSGGPDSVALAAALRQYAPERALQLHIAHLDHMLRPDSAADAAYVLQLAQAWSIPAIVEARDVASLAARTGHGLEQAARLARYAFLAQAAAEVGAATVVVAHHADDQAETLLMNLIRGSGLEGLKAMTPVARYPLTADEIERTLGRGLVPMPERLVRPLLDVSRSTILAYLGQLGLPVRDDPSNRDLRFLRNRVRHQILPLLEKENPRLREALRRTSQLVADDLALLEPLVEEAWQQCAGSRAGATCFRRAVWDGLPPALQRRLLRRAVTSLPGLRPLGAEHIEALRLAASGRPHPGLPGGLRLEGNEQAFWLTRDEPSPPPPLGQEPITIPAGGRLALPAGWTLVVHRGTAGQSPPPASAWTAVVDARLASQGLAVRGRRPGDRLAPAGMKGRHQRLQDLFVDRRVPRAEREAWPLVVLGDEVIWVPGLRLSERASMALPEHDWVALTFEPPSRLASIAPGSLRPRC